MRQTGPLESVIVLLMEELPGREVRVWGEDGEGGVSQANQSHLYHGYSMDHLVFRL